jgi:hypothetical protein
MSKRTKVIQLKLTQQEYDLIQAGLPEGCTLLQYLRFKFKLPDPKPLNGTPEWIEQQTKSKAD